MLLLRTLALLMSRLEIQDYIDNVKIKFIDYQDVPTSTPYSVLPSLCK